MSMFCPMGFANGHSYCSTQCALYQGGCMIAKALNIYIKNNTPLTIKKPNVEHDYDEYGVDWYPHGYDDIAP